MLHIALFLSHKPLCRFTLFSQYGYRLPPEENVFYNVQFYYIRGKVFTYPLYEVFTGRWG